MVLISGEPGLGKTRLVQECRKLFMAWVGATSGRLPLWLEARRLPMRLLAPMVSTSSCLRHGWVSPPRRPRGYARGGGEGAGGYLRRRLGGRACPAAHCGYRRRARKCAGRPGEPQPRAVATGDIFRDACSRLCAGCPRPGRVGARGLAMGRPTSLRLSEELSTVAREGPLLLVLTRRPEPDPGVSALEAALGTARTSGYAGSSYLRSHRRQARPRHFSSRRGNRRQGLGRRGAGADGNPLFIEERFSSLLETGALSDDGDGGTSTVASRSESRRRSAPRPAPNRPPHRERPEGHRRHVRPRAPVRSHATRGGHRPRGLSGKHGRGALSGRPPCGSGARDLSRPIASGTASSKRPHTSACSGPIV